MQLKKNLLSMLFIMLSIMMTCGCVRYTPRPVNPDAKVSTTVSKYKSFVFEEEPIPPRACLILRSVEDTSFESTYLHAVQKHLAAHGVNIVADKREADFVIEIFATTKEITPEPNCRIEQHIMMTIRDCKGNQLLNTWTYDSKMPHGVESMKEAKRQVWDDSIRALSEWFRVNYYIMTMTEKAWVSSIVRIKINRARFMHSTARGEDVATKMLYDLKTVKGIIEARLVEKDTNAMMFSYRVFYNKQNISEPITASLGRIGKKYEK